MNVNSVSSTALEAVRASQLAAFEPVIVEREPESASLLNLDNAETDSVDIDAIPDMSQAQAAQQAEMQKKVEAEAATRKAEMMRAEAEQATRKAEEVRATKEAEEATKMAEAEQMTRVAEAATRNAESMRAGREAELRAMESRIASRPRAMMTL